MKKILLAFISCLIFENSYSQKKEICMTVDDLPVVSYGNVDNFYQWDITLNLISKFDKYHIPAIGFVNEGKMYNEGVLDSTQLDLLNMWFQNGYEIGNHTYGHLSYHKTAFEDFTTDIIRGERHTRQLALEYNRELTYFRHPYLHAGQNAGRYDSLNRFLKDHGYTVAPVTIDNDDYLFAFAYAAAEREKDQEKMSAIGTAYIEYMEQKLLFFEGQAMKLFGRSIKQTLLIHASKLNADYMDELAEMILSNGYQFISMSGALEDVAYQSEVTVFGSNGISWLDRWAMSQGKSGDFFTGDPVVPEWIKKKE